MGWSKLSFKRKQPLMDSILVKEVFKNPLGLDKVKFIVNKLYLKHICPGSSKSSLRVITPLIKPKEHITLF